MSDMKVDNTDETEPVMTRPEEEETVTVTELAQKVKELATELKSVQTKFAGFIQEIERQFILVKRAINSNVHAVYRVILTHNKAFHDQPELCVKVECKRSDEDVKETTETKTTKNDCESKAKPEAETEVDDAN